MYRAKMKTIVRETLEWAYSMETEFQADFALYASLEKEDCKPCLREALLHAREFRQWGIIFWRNVRNCKIDLIGKNLEMMKSSRNDFAGMIFDASEHIPDDFYKDNLEEVQKMYDICRRNASALEMTYSNGVRWKCTIKSHRPKYKIDVPEHPTST